MKKLEGYSGCKLELLASGDVVRKTSKSEEYNLRLEAQCLKQAAFKHDMLYAPTVLDMGYDPAGLFYFDMEYIDGPTLAQMVINEDNCLWTIDILRQAICLEDVPELEPKPFVLKLRQLQEAIADCDPAFAEAVEFLLNQDWSGFPAGYCHGDLTLENIIVQGKRLYLIDFLDSFCDSPLLDMAKLLQDLQCGWAFRDHSLSPAATKMLEDCQCRLLLSLTERQRQQCSQALLLHLLRIVPYSARDKRTAGFLHHAIASILQKHQKEA